MKSYPDRFIRGLQSQSQGKGILLYGPEEQIIEECQQQVLNFFKQKKSLDTLRLVASQAIADPWLLYNHGQAGLFGTGLPVIIIEEASDKLLPTLIEFWKSSSGPQADTQIILRGLGLKTTSKLVKHYEAESTLMSVGCYIPDLPAIRSQIQARFKAAGYSSVPEVEDTLLEIGNYHTILATIDQLMLYKGDDKKITPCDAALFVDTENSVETIIEGVLEKNPALLKSFPLEEDWILMIRILINRFVRLYHLRCMVSEGASLDKAIGDLKPPVFFKQMASLKRQFSLWSEEEIILTLENLSQMEQQLKTSYPSIALQKKLVDISISGYLRAQLM